MSFLTVSDQAWEIIEQVNYQGYEALKPFRYATRDGLFPYTPYWHGMAALNVATEALLKEGLDNSYKRHAEAADHCRKRLAAMGLTLYPDPSAIPSPTITAIKVPEQISWAELDKRMRHYGLVAGGNYGVLANKVFRLGHMGTQANKALVDQACDVLEKVLKPG
jgi:aspartate aminotransferase-like enzyme